MRIVGVILVLLGLVLCFTIIGIFFGIPMILIGITLIALGGRRKTIIQNVVTVSNAPYAGQPQSPLGPLAAFATADGYKVKQDANVPFHGYFFRILTKQTSNTPGGAKDYIADGKMAGGFAFVAHPADYGNTGIMTFIVNQDGVLLQKDLGKTTAETAKAMSAFDPDNSWNLVGD